MSGNFAVVREMSGNWLFVRECQGKILSGKTIVFKEQTSINWWNSVLLDMDRTQSDSKLVAALGFS